VATMPGLSGRAAAAQRRRADEDSPLGKADHGPCECLFQPGLPLRNCTIDGRKESLDLAEFRGAFMATSIDRALEQPQPDFLRQRCEGARVVAAERSAAIRRREV